MTYDLSLVNIKFINNHNIIEFKGSNVYIIENIFSDELCNNLINLMKKLPSEKSLYSNNNNVECYVSHLNNFLHIDDREFYEFNTDKIIYDELLSKVKNKEKIYNNNLNGITRKEISNYLLLFDNKTQLIKKIMSDVQPKIVFDYNCGFALRKIFGPTRLHMDGLQIDKNFNKTFFQMNRESRDINMNIDIIRCASAVFTLNDDYDNGFFKFPNLNISLKLKKGSVLIFPPYWTHLHETEQLLNNTYRYTLNTWYGQSIPTLNTWYGEKTF